MFKRLQLSAILSVALCMGAGLYSDAKAGPKNKKGIVIPVLYVTDRNEDGSTFGSKRKYPLGCKHDMYYGTALVEIPANTRDLASKDEVQGGNDSTENSVQTDSERLDWKLTEKYADKESQKDKIKDTSPASEKAKFFERLEAELDKAKTDSLVVYVHGGASPFEDCAWDAANFEYQFACPTILYSWPSVGNFDSYRVDEGNAEWSQEHYNAFLQDLEAFSKHRKINVTLVAHSMGNRLVARSVGVLKNGGAFLKDVELASPDIDAETFAHYVMHYRNHGVKARLYLSDKDKILSATQWLYGGYYRLGERMGAMLTMWSAPQQVWTNAKAKLLKTTAAVQRKKANIANNSNNSSNSSNSKAPAATPTVTAAADSETPSPGGEQLTPDLERIDFTGIDEGFYGHRIQFQLIADMARFGAPRDGLSLVPGRPNSKGNWISRFARWKNDIAPLENVAQNTCRRVIRVSKDEQQSPKSASSEPATSPVD